MNDVVGVAKMSHLLSD